MLYNGGENQPEHTVEYLSDAFTELVGHPRLQLEVDVFNISRNGAHVRNGVSPWATTAH